MEKITTWNIGNIPHYKHNVVTEVIWLFLDNGADQNLKYLHNIQHYKQNVATEAVQLLLIMEQITTWNVGSTPHYKHDVVTEVIQLFLDNGAGHNSKNHNIMCKYCGSNVVTEVVQLLVDNGADCKLKNCHIL